MSLEGFPKQVSLKDNRKVTVRLLEEGDFDQLSLFFHALSDEERIFFRHDVLDPKLLKSWVTDINLDDIIPLVAAFEGRIVGKGTLHFQHRGWLRHVGHLRIVTAADHRRNGLGTMMAHELVELARQRDLEMLKVEVIAANTPMINMLERMGFRTGAVLKGLAKDIRGHTQDMVIMVNDISHLSRLLEDWIVDSMIPAFRAPGGGMP
jgi:ribosomal protein S18 acetylase RimI-like enzyme